MSNFDLSLIGDADEKEIRKACRLKESEVKRLDEYVSAVNAAREARGMKPVDDKYLMPKLIMRGIDTEMAELPEYLTQKVKRAKKRRGSEAQAGEGESLNDENPIEQLPQAAE